MVLGVFKHLGSSALLKPRSYWIWVHDIVSFVLKKDINLDMWILIHSAIRRLVNNSFKIFLKRRNRGLWPRHFSNFENVAIQAKAKWVWRSSNLWINLSLRLTHKDSGNKNMKEKEGRRLDCDEFHERQVPIKVLASYVIRVNFGSRVKLEDE